MPLPFPSKNSPMVSSAAAMGFKGLAIDDAEMPRVEEGNHLLGPQRRQRSTYSFHRNREVVRDVVAGHRQGDRSVRLDLSPIGHLEQESAYALQCAVTAQKDRSRLHSIDRVERDFAYAARQLRIGLHE